MAEQAINTIYALGEHPDVLCNDLIKSLTRRVFGPREANKQRERSTSPDAMEDMALNNNGPEAGLNESPSPQSDKADAFELSQLLFTVGHVAIKQIVYLELVEREWKRQKDEKEKGMFHTS